MSVEKNREEALRWLQTARQDLETARILLDNKRYAHCCFHAHQSGEKSLKAVWYYKDGDPWGHSIHKLIQELKEFDAELFNSLRDLSAIGAKLVD